MGRICAIDLGTKRIGLALSDELKLLAQPFKTVKFKSDKKFIDELLILITEKNIDMIVIGLPLLPDGIEGPGCIRARSFEKKLNEKGIITHLFDERYSSETAEEVLLEFGKKRKNNKDKVDMIAAAVILKSYLESLEI